MKKTWLKLILRLSSYIHAQKTRMLTSGPLTTILFGSWVILLELALFAVSVPTYLFVSPANSSDLRTLSTEATRYHIRKKISLTALGGLLFLWLLKSLMVIFFAFEPSSGLKAATVSWNFSDPAEYIYDSGKIQIADSMAIFRPAAGTAAAESASTTGVETPGQTGEASSSADVSPDATEEAASTTPPAGPPVSQDTAPEPPHGDGAGTETVQPETAPAPSDAPVAPETGPPADVAPPQEPAPAESPPDNAPPSPTSFLWNERWLLALRDALTPPVYAAEGALCEALLQPLNSFSVERLIRWTGIVVVAETNGGELAFQLSPDDGATWYAWQDDAWTATTDAAAYNAEQEINRHIQDFPAASGKILFRAKFINDCSREMKLLGISLEYEQREEIAPEPASTSTEVLPPNVAARTTSTLEETEKMERSLPDKSLRRRDERVAFTDERGREITSTKRRAYVEFDARKVAYIELDQDADFSETDIGNEDRRSWIHLKGPERTALSKIQLIFPKFPEDEYARVCPGAATADEIGEDCPGEIRLNAEHPADGGYALVRIDDPENWYVEASPEKFSTGGEGASSRLVSEWKLNENSGCAAADAKGLNNATLMPNCPANSPTWIAGITGSALHFDGSNDFARAPNTTSLRPASLTVSAWIYLDGLPTNREYGIVDKGGANRGYELYVRTQTANPAPRRIAWRIRNTEVYSAAIPATSAWINVIGAYDGSVMSLFVNGVFQASSTATMQYDNNAFFIGRRPTANRSILGRIDDVSLYNFALTQNEIDSLNAVPGCSVLYSDNFQDGSASDWAHTYDAGTNWSVINDSGEYKYRHNSSAYSQTQASSTYANDYLYTATARLNSLGSHGLLFRYSNDNNYWRFILENGLARFSGKVAGSSADANGMNAYLFTPSAGSVYNLKIQSNGQNLRAKWWETGSAEPSSWLLAATDNRLSTGGIGLINQGSADYDNLTVSSCLESESLTPFIQVVRPNGGEGASVGSEALIEWNSLSASGNVKIEYSKDDFAADLQTIAISAPDTGSYAWPVPNDPSANVKIRVSDAANPALKDESDAAFRIVSTSTSPLSSWPFDDNAGCAALDSSDGRNGALAPACPADAPVWTAGKINSALQFNGASTYVNVPDEPGLTLANTFSVSAWAYPTALGSQRTVLSKANSYELTQGSAPGELRLAVYANGAWRALETVSAPLAAGAWSFVAGTYDGTSLKLYVNGALAASQSLSAYIAASAYDLAIGATKAGPANFWEGKLDEVTLWNRPLLPSEINTLYLTGNNTAPSLAIQSAAQQAANDPVRIDYTLTDAESNFISLPTYEYSLTGAFNGEEHTMTAATGNASHEGVTTLTSSPTGTAHVFMWDASADLVGTSNASVYVRLRPNDGLANGAYGTSSAFAVDAVAPVPVPTEPTGGGGGGGGGLSATPKTSAPIRPVLDQPASSSGPDVALSGAAEPGAWIDLYSDGVRLQSFSRSQANGRFSGIWHAASGAHELYVVAIDPYGNVSQPSVHRFVTVASPAPAIVPPALLPLPGIGVTGTVVGAPQPAPVAIATATPGLSPVAPVPAVPETAAPAPTLPTEIGEITGARESPIIPTPTVESVTQEALPDTVVFSGRGIPNSRIALFVYSEQALVYFAQADAAGNWQVTHSQKETELSPGDHTVYAVTYDQGGEIKSRPGSLRAFTVSVNPWALVFGWLNLFTTAIALIITLGGTATYLYLQAAKRLPAFAR